MKYKIFPNSDYLQKYVKTGVLLSILFMAAINTRAQVKDSTTVKKEKQFKNTVKINLTSFILYQNGVQLNYERILSKKSSITVWGGPIQFPMPTVIANSSMEFIKDKEKSGYTFGADYRFYLAKENKYDAPRGVYLAPFISYYHFNNQRSGRDTANQNQLTLNSTLNMLNIGGELGYQFVIKKRFVVDCVLLGPALTSYNWTIQLDGATSGDLTEKQQAILEALKNKFPLLKDLAGDKKISSSGVADFWSIGFRYAIHIGYRF